MNYPGFYDDWVMMGVQAGDKSIDAAWLWKPQNDHRVPIPKLILYGLYQLTGWDFRTGMFVNAALLSAVALGLMLMAARLRGRADHADAFFPIVLLGWGHYEQLLWSWQLTQVIPVIIVLGLLTRMVYSGIHLSPREGVLSGMAVLALPFCGIPGLVYVPGFALWLGAIAVWRWRLGSFADKWVAGAIALFAGLSVLLIPLYFIGLDTSIGARPAVSSVVRTMIAFAAHGLGAAAENLGAPVVVVVALFIVLSAALVFRGLWDQNPKTRSRGLAMIFFLCGFAGLALSVGVARPGESFPPRYYLQAVPILCWVYFSFLVFGGRWLSVRGTLGLALVVLSVLGLNYKVGLDYGRERASAFSDLERDLLSGAPVQQIVAHHQRTVFPYPESGGASFHYLLVRGFDAFRQSGIGIFAQLHTDAAFRETPLNLIATLESSDEDSSLILSLPTPMFVAGLRMDLAEPASQVDSLSAGAPMYLAETIVSWRRSAVEDFTQERSYIHWWLAGEGSLEFWIYDEIEALRINHIPYGDAVTPPDITILTPRSLPGETVSGGEDHD